MQSGCNLPQFPTRKSRDKTGGFCKELRQHFNSKLPSKEENCE